MINKSKETSHYRWFVIALIFVLFMVAQADRANIGFAIPFIQKEYGLTNTEIGIIISLFFAGYGLCQIPAGFFVKRKGIRFSYAAGMLLTSLFTFMMGKVDSVLHLKILRTLVGISEAPVVISSTATINNWFPTSEKGTATGIFLAGSKFGPLLVPPVCAWILINYDWRHIFLFFSIPGVVLALVWYILVRDRPAESRFVSQQEADYIAEMDEDISSGRKLSSSGRAFRYCWIDRLIRTEKLSPLESSRQIFRSWDIIGAAIGYMCMVGIVDGVIMSWLPKYLLQEHHLTLVSSATLAATPFAGNVVGNLCGGWISDNLLAKRRKPLMIFSAVSTIVMTGLMTIAPQNPYLLGVLLFLLGFLIALGYSAYSVYAMARASRETYPVAYAIINMGGQLGAVCMPLIVGVLLDRYSWNAVFITLGVAAALCLTVVLTIREPLPVGAKIN